MTSSRIAVVLVAAVVLGYTSTSRADDKQLQCLLVGTWAKAEDLNGGIRSEAMKTLTASGRFDQSGTLTLAPSGRSLAASYSGTWKVDAGRIIYTLESSTGLSFAARGSSLADQIVLVDEHSFTYIDTNGIKHTEKRVSEPRSGC